MKSIFNVLIVLVATFQNPCFSLPPNLKQFTVQPYTQELVVKENSHSIYSRDGSIHAHFKFASPIAHISNSENQVAYTLNHGKVINSLAISPNSSMVVTTSLQDSSVKIWDAPTGWHISTHTFPPEENIMIHTIQFDNSDPKKFYITTANQLNGRNKIYVFTDQFGKRSR